jgi:CubicO group peptidase (beta-lactamase class C family)
MLAVPSSARAQSLTFSLLERYLESLRVQAGIPGISALVSQNGTVVWRANFGRQNAETSLPPTSDTPYLIGGLSQAFGSALLLKKCFEENSAELPDRVRRWEPDFPEPDTTLHDLLTHTSRTGEFRYDLSRFGALTPVIEECANVRYSQVLAGEIFERFGMMDSVPGDALAAPTSQERELFPPATLQRYAGVVSRLAIPYRVDSRGRATRSAVSPVAANAATGIVSSAEDLGRFNAALDADALLQRATRTAAWTQATSSGAAVPTGLGWFVQNYNNQPIVWQFGAVEGAYSSLIIKAPNRGVTMILLANSDGLSAPFALETGDVTTSLFAQVLLRLLVP